MIGIGAMLYSLGGGSPENPEKYVGRKIVEAKLVDNAVYITFSDGVELKLWDAGQSCCESRYITTDDDLSSLAGCTLLHIDPKRTEEKEDGYGSHEMCFIEIGTDKGFVTLVTHNEHNGYYGGFGLSLAEV